jgi:hypothetical protein
LIALRAHAERERRRRAARTAARYANDPAGFIRDCVWIDDAQGESAGGVMPFHLWPAQEALLEAIAHEPRVLILKARQLGLTWLACAYGLWLCLHQDRRLVLTFSVGQDEANEMMRRMTVMYDHLPPAVRAGLPRVVKRNTEELAWENGSRVESLPSRTTAGSGYTASLVILDEFAKNPNADTVYTAVKPTIDGGGKLVILSTAHGTGNLFHDLVTRAQAGAGRFAFHFLPWQARPGRDAAWYAEVAADAVDMAHMQQEYPASPEEAFAASEVDAFLPDMALWRVGCLDAAIPPLDAHTRCVLALDAGESNDAFAAVLVSAWRDGLAVRWSRAWVPTPGVALDFDAIEAEVRGLLHRYAIQQVAYDPFLLGQFVRRLTTRDPVPAPCVPFPQGQARLESDKGLYDLITTRRLAHDGQQATLTEHLANANRKLDADGRMRIIKRAYRLKIDLAVALGMAAQRAGETLAYPGWTQDDLATTLGRTRL